VDKTRFDPHVNLLRSPRRRFPQWRGRDAIDIRPFDEVAGDPTELGLRMSRNLHDILAKSQS